MTSTLFKNKRICQDNGIKIVRARLVYCSTIWVCLCVCNSKTSTENKHDDKKESTNDKSGLFEIKMKSLQLNVLVRLKPLHALWFSLVRHFFFHGTKTEHIAYAFVCPQMSIAFILWAVWNLKCRFSSLMHSTGTWKLKPKHTLNINNAIVFLVHLQNCVRLEFLLHLYKPVLHSSNL